jgi:hypothetical protein
VSEAFSSQNLSANHRQEVRGTVPALKRSIFRKAAAAAALSFALGAGALIAAAPASAAVCPEFSNCAVGTSTVYVTEGTMLRANKYGWPTGTKLEYRWYSNGSRVAGGWNYTHPAWGPKGTKWVVRVKGTLHNQISYRVSRTYIVR